MNKQVWLLIGLVVIFTAIVVNFTTYAAEFSGPLAEAKAFALGGTLNDDVYVQDRHTLTGLTLLIAYHTKLNQLAIVVITMPGQYTIFVADPCNDKYSLGMFKNNQYVGGASLDEIQAEKYAADFIKIYIGAKEI